MVKKSVPKKKRSGPYVWVYSSPSKTKKRRAHKRRGLTNVPPSAMSIIANKLHRNVGSLYAASPKSVRNVLTPHMAHYKQVANLRSKIDPMLRTSVNTRTVNPGYIRIAQRLHQLNRTPNRNYEMRGEFSTGWHVRRVQSMMNLLRRLRQPLAGDPDEYYNERNNRNFSYNSRSKTLIAQPRHPRGAWVTIARDLNRRPNGSMFFNLRKRHDRKRGRT